MRGRHDVILALTALIACSRRDDLAALRDRAVEIASSHRTEVDALVARVATLKVRLRGNLPGWESALRTAELASDELGLPPFTQQQPPGPGWRPSPASLLGIAPYVETRASELASQHRRAELQFLVDDEQARYTRGIAEVTARLDEVDRWLGSAH